MKKCPVCKKSLNKMTNCIKCIMGHQMHMKCKGSGTPNEICPMCHDTNLHKCKITKSKKNMSRKNRRNTRRI
jgi:hypothetical protein